uniref:Uncharacterized protein n=1 Tax=Meloidogyne hapla TaxID=6305 RepID=A0A1I8B0Z8_MELHA
MPSIEVEITKTSSNINSASAGDIQSGGKRIDDGVKDKKATEPPSLYPYPYGSWPY